MTPKLARKRMVCVVWEDAHGDALGDFTESEVARDFHKPAKYSAFGLLILSDAEGVTLAGEQSPEGFRNMSFVPAKMIVEIVDLGVPARKQVRNKKSREAATVETP